MDLKYYWSYNKIATLEEIKIIISEINKLLDVLKFELKIIGEKSDSVYSDFDDSQQQKDSYDEYDMDNVFYMSDGMMNYNQIYFNCVKGEYYSNKNFHLVWSCCGIKNYITAKHNSKYGFIANLILLSIANNTKSFMFAITNNDANDKTNGQINCSYTNAIFESFEMCKQFYEKHIKTININFCPIDKQTCEIICNQSIISISQNINSSNTSNCSDVDGKIISNTYTNFNANEELFDINNKLKFEIIDVIYDIV